MGIFSVELSTIVYFPTRENLPAAYAVEKGQFVRTDKVNRQYVNKKRYFVKL
jgi:hypothetical protein